MLTKLLDAAIVFTLAVVIGATVYGHWGGEGCGLNLVDSYITEYMKMAPHWPWLIVASFFFALLLSLLAFALLLSHGRNVWVIAGCLLLTATSMANFFVAYSPVRRVEQPPAPAHEWWTPSWWFTSHTARTPYEDGLADAYSDVHYRATRLAVVTGIVAVLLVTVGFVGVPSARAFFRVSVIAVVAMSILFLMGDHLAARRGLWQRLGFVIMYGWFWLAFLTCRNSRSAWRDSPGISPHCRP